MVGGFAPAFFMPMILPILFAQPSSPEQSNVSLDDEQLKDEVPKSVQKVELDLDDALFLEFEDPVPAPPPQEQTAPIEPEAASEIVLAEEGIASVPLWKKMWFQGLMALVVIILGGGIAFLLMRPAVPPPPVQELMPDQDLSSDFSKEHSEHLFTMQPFIVEFKQGENIGFLKYAFAIPCDNSTLHEELESKTLVLRDAIYQYLTSAELIPPDKSDNMEKVKNATILLINNIVETGQISSLYIAEYGVL